MPKIYSAGDQLTASDYNAIVKTAGLYAADAGGDDTYAITCSPAPGSYADGDVYHFKPTTPNTGSCTIDINGLGAKTIKKFSSGGKVDLITGDIIANQPCTVIYDGTDFILISSQRPLFAHGQTTRTAGTGDGTQTIPHGLGVVPRFIRITATAIGTSNTQLGMSIGTATTISDEKCIWIAGNNGIAFTTGQDSTSIIFCDSGTGAEYWSATLATLDATNIELTCNINGSAGTLYIQWEAFA